MLDLLDAGTTNAIDPEDLRDILDGRDGIARTVSASDSDVTAAFRRFDL
ncbi:hypothetical protein ABIE45_004829 [Methylobacterium sp. OAE515]